MTCSIITNKHPSRVGRVGTLPYTVINDEIYILMGIDRRTGEYSDFGGGRKGRENFVQGALRECREETEGLINFTTIDSVQACWNYDLGIIFLPLALDRTGMSELTEHFKANDTTEMSALNWLNWGDFTLTLNNISRAPFIYYKVRQLLQNTIQNYPLQTLLKEQFKPNALECKCGLLENSREVFQGVRKTCRTIVVPPVINRQAKMTLSTHPQSLCYQRATRAQFQIRQQSSTYGQNAVKNQKYMHERLSNHRTSKALSVSSP